MTTTFYKTIVMIVFSKHEVFKNTSCLENTIITMVLSARRGFLHACIFQQLYNFLHCCNFLYGFILIILIIPILNIHTQVINKQITYRQWPVDNSYFLMKSSNKQSNHQYNNQPGHDDNEHSEIQTSFQSPIIKGIDFPTTNYRNIMTTFVKESSKCTESNQQHDLHNYK